MLSNGHMPTCPIPPHSVNAQRRVRTTRVERDQVYEVIYLTCIRLNFKILFSSSWDGSLIFLEVGSYIFCRIYLNLLLIDSLPVPICQLGQGVRSWISTFINIPHYHADRMTLVIWALTNHWPISSTTIYKGRSFKSTFINSEHKMSVRPIFVVAGVGKGFGELIISTTFLSHTRSYDNLPGTGAAAAWVPCNDLFLFLNRIISRAFSKAGYSIALIARNAESLKSLADEIKSGGGDVSSSSHLLMSYIYQGTSGCSISNFIIQIIWYPIRIQVHQNSMALRTSPRSPVERGSRSLETVPRNHPRRSTGNCGH